VADEELWDRIEEILDDSEEFWTIDVSDELIAALTLAYLDGLEGAAEYIGQLAGVAIELAFDLVDPVALEFIQDRAAEMVRNVNRGTKHYLRTMIYNGLQDGIPEQDLIDGIFENLFEQSEFSEQRIRSITRFETARVQSAAWEKQMDEVGLETKRWVTIGADACEVCKANEAMGPQPVNSKTFDNVFGEKCGGPPAHPNV